MNRIRLVLAACLLVLPAALYAQSSTLVVKLGSDTIAVETFTLTPTHYEGELVTRGMGPRWKYSGQVAMGRIRELHTALYGGADTAATQSARLTMAEDSVIAEVTANGNTSTQRLATSRGAFPLINLAFSFVEMVTMQASALQQDSVRIPFFMVSGGQTFFADLRKLGPDSASLTLAGVALILKTDAHGRIVRGAVPAQNITIERTSSPVRLEVKRADYSAPAGARYTAEQVRIPAPAGHTLAGTFTLPKQRTGPVPVVVTISGSGLQDRDEALPMVSGYRPFRQIAEALADMGVGVLRYDDRGFGESQGNAGTATSVDLAADVQAALAYLRGRREVAKDKLFLLGHSEGGIIAPMVAVTDTSLRGIALLAGTSRTGRKVLEYQNRYMLDQRKDMTRAARDSAYNEAVIMLDSIGGKQPWLDYFLSYDPLPTVRRVRIPVLILQGATDRQVTADQAEELAAALRAAGNQAVELHVLPGVNHLFLRDPDGNPVGYSALKDPSVVSEAIDIIRSWLAKNMK